MISCYSAAIPSTFLQRPVQFSLTVQAEDYDTCIAGPQREERLRRMEEHADEAHLRVQGGGSDTEGRGTSV